jgi:hypothetical protein
MWGLSDALDVIRPLQFKALQYGYHLALGGGVLNKGMSSNDLDIIVLPLDQRPCDRHKFLAVADKYLGTRTTIDRTKPHSAPDDENLYRFERDGRIVDLLFYSR